MKRSEFFKRILGVSALLSMDSFFSVANVITNSAEQHFNESELATFGAIHLNNTSLEKSTKFWTTIVGLQLRGSTQTTAEFGTAEETLVVVHQTAKSAYKEGYSGLYHFAIHAHNKHEFAKMLYRLLENQYPCSPIDHTMSQSIYFKDPDNITIEIALETPERFKRVITEGGLMVEDTDGVVKFSSTQLEVAAVLAHLQDKNLATPTHSGTKIGHIHLYANDVEHSNLFYQQLGFLPFNYLPQYMYADLGAGGLYQHRIAMNAWHGKNKPLAPPNSAGLRYFQLVYESDEELQKAIAASAKYEQKNEGYWLQDPTGNNLLLSYSKS